MMKTLQERLVFNLLIVALAGCATSTAGSETPVRRPLLSPVEVLRIADQAFSAKELRMDRYVFSALQYIPEHESWAVAYISQELILGGDVLLEVCDCAEKTYEFSKSL